MSYSAIQTVLLVVLQKLQALLFHSTDLLDGIPLAAEVVPSVQARFYTTVLPGNPWEPLFHNTAQLHAALAQHRIL